MRRTLKGNKYGIRWHLGKHLEDLDFVDDLALLSETWKQAQEKLNRLNKYSLQTGLKINIKKTESMRIQAKNHNPFKINETEVNDVKSFKYLGANISGGAKEEMKIRIGKTRSTYYRLNKVWRSSYTGEKLN